MQNGNSVKKRAYAAFLSDTIAFRNPYLVKSLNLAFTLVLFRSVYLDVAPSNARVRGRNCLRPSLTPEHINLV